MGFARLDEVARNRCGNASMDSCALPHPRNMNPEGKNHRLERPGQTESSQEVGTVFQREKTVPRAGFSASPRTVWGKRWTLGEPGFSWN